MMNDFTKEELKELKRCLGYVDYSLYINNHGNLLTKLKHMIDNYCDHDCEGGEVDLFVDTCKKCDAYILREDSYEHG